MTWPEVIAAAKAVKAKIGTPEMAAVKFPVTSSWMIWAQLEQFGAIHDLPFATKANGFEGLDAELAFNGPHQVAQWDRLLGMAKEGLYEYGGRDTVPDAIFYSGQAAIGFGSSAGRGDIVRNAKFKWAAAFLPIDPAVTTQSDQFDHRWRQLTTMTTRSSGPRRNIKRSRTS